MAWYGEVRSGMSGEITKSKIVELGFSAEPKAVDDAALQIVCSINMQDVESVVDAFKEQDELLKQAQEFSELRAKYAALEAATYKRIVDRGWASALKPSSNICKAAKWLAEEPEKYEERLSAILHGDCTLVSLWKEDCALRDKMDTVKTYLRERRDEIQRYDREGRASVGDVPVDSRALWDMEYHFDRYLDACGRIYWETPRDLAEVEQALINDTRIKLRAKGAVGIGYGEYIDPERHPEELMEAIGIRKKNIASCVNRLRELCEIVEYLDFEKELKEALSMAMVDANGLQ